MEENQDLERTTMPAREALHALTDALTDLCDTMSAALAKLARDGNPS